jgi:hypothetical protein
MKIGIIKKLAENETLEILQASEEKILNEETPSIEIEGEDTGEQLTHVSAAIWVKQKIASDGLSIKEAVRAYTQRVRSSLF